MVALLASSCEDSREGRVERTPAEADAALIQAIHDAVRQEADTDSISRMINYRAEINTTKTRDRVRVSQTHFAPDLERGSRGPTPEVWLKQAINVVYWRRPGSWDTPRIVGVAWFANKSPEIFFAAITGAQGDDSSVRSTR